MTLEHGFILYCSTCSSILTISTNSNAPEHHTAGLAKPLGYSTWCTSNNTNNRKEMIGESRNAMIADERPQSPPLAWMERLDRVQSTKELKRCLHTLKGDNLAANDMSSYQ